MFLRVFTFLLLIICITSCDYFSFTKKTKQPVLDTIVDFSSVDIFPSFKVCDSIITKQKKSDCFRETIHKKIGEELQKHQFTIKDSISETVFVTLLINSEGKIVLEEIRSSEKIKEELPKLDSILELSVKKIPTIFPAIKRGIPVTTKYKLPINIQLQE